MKNRNNVIKKIDSEIVSYVETEIIPLYDAFDSGHGRSHVHAVIADSLQIAEAVGANLIWRTLLQLITIREWLKDANIII